MHIGRIRLPHEVSASIVAFATVFLLMSPLKMPTWAIFITWAGTFLQGGPSRSNAIAMVTATTTGAGFGVVAVLLNRETGTMFGTGAFAQTLALAVVIFVVNGTLLATGRLKPFALIPGMFFGFASSSRRTSAASATTRATWTPPSSAPPRCAPWAPSAPPSAYG